MQNFMGNTILKGKITLEIEGWAKPLVIDASEILLTGMWGLTTKVDPNNGCALEADQNGTASYQIIAKVNGGAKNFTTLAPRYREEK